MSNKAPFDPNNPFDAAVESLRIHITIAFARWLKAQDASGLDADQELSAATLGLSVATVGCVLSILSPDAPQDKIIKYIGDHLPVALGKVNEINSNADRMGETVQ